MRHRVHGRHFGRDTAHRRSMYRNLLTDLLRFERITTTEAKAKELRPMAERLITLGKRGDLHARRQVLGTLYDPRVVKHVFDEIAPRMATRPGGYLRITKLEPRKGDGAAMATIELVDYVDAPPTPRPQRVTAAPTAAAAPVSGRSTTATAVAEPVANDLAAEADTLDEAPADAVDAELASVADDADEAVAEVADQSQAAADVDASDAEAEAAEADVAGDDTGDGEEPKES